MADYSSCMVCGARNSRSIFLLERVPVLCNQLSTDAASARAAPVADVDLEMCSVCGFIWNRSFDTSLMKYTTGYENALHYSPVFQLFIEDLAKKFIARFDLSGQRIIEIGCGDGYMLDLLVKHGAAAAIGYDPSMAGRDSQFTSRQGVEIIPEYFSSSSWDQDFAAVVCRHVLEHLDNPMKLLSNVRSGIGDRDVKLYIEVPNAEWMLEEVSLWDVIYEHCGYWSVPSITTALKRCGFDPVSVSSGYNGQFLMVEAVPGTPSLDVVADGVAEISALADDFRASAQGELSKWVDRLGHMDGRAVIWGAGSKGITLANAIGPASRALAALIDLNDRKHGLCVPGVALPVLSPQALQDIRPDLVLVSNALYEEEIIEMVKEMDLSPQFEAVAG